MVDAADGRYEIARYCPHAGEDLAIGSAVRAGVIRCLGHNLEFDLATGACLNARCDPLVTRRLAATADTTAGCSPHPGGSDVVRAQ